jgi:anhydro-N-acetylmuramic acid kinase
MMNTRAIGLVSGTSADGIDAALVTIREAEGERLQVQLDHSLTVPYPEPVRDLLFEAFDDRVSVSRLCILNALLGELFAEAARLLADSAGVPLSQVDFIASHGQTVWHQPEAVELAGRRVAGTLQLGEAAVIAERTGCRVVADFRPRDLAAGGQGAPLVPYVDWLLFSHPTRTRAVQNIGGIGNVTYLPAGGGREAIVAFDTGPGNALIDAAVTRATGGRRRQDTGGEFARQGRVDSALLAELLAHPYFARRPPKSTGRELFGAAFVDSLWPRVPRPEDLIATLTEFTAASIERSYEEWLAPRGRVEEVILGGGGARNPALVAALRRRLDPAPLLHSEAFGLSSDAKEAIAFALLGYETLRTRPANVPTATGAERAVVLGKITPGRPEEQVE